MDTLRDRTFLEEEWRSGPRNGESGDRARVLAWPPRIPDRSHWIQGRVGIAPAALPRRRGVRFALSPEDDGLFVAAGVKDDVRHRLGDVRDLPALHASLDEAQPTVVVHMAAQPLVRESYARPMETYATNVMGTVNLLEAVRHVGSVRAVVVVTSDKCYENLAWVWGYRETDRLGGHDPYSNSKACAELVTEAYRRSFFDGKGAALIASCRAGNVIGAATGRAIAWCRMPCGPFCGRMCSESAIRARSDRGNTCSTRSPAIFCLPSAW
jgi:hypothetical protein